VRLPAKIVHDDGHLTDVVIVNISATGAALELPYAASLSRRLSIMIPSKGQEFDAELVRRNGYDAAVRFISPDEVSDTHRTRVAAVSPKVSLNDLRSMVRLKTKR